MPITPFHFGPGALVHAVAPRHVSFLAFCAANVLIDVESLYNLVHQRSPVHAFFHTYVGATLIALAVPVLFVAMVKLASRLPVPNIFGWRNLSAVQVGVGGALGAYSHVALDSLMHSDITPFAPASSDNALLGLVSLSSLHWSCVIAGAIGVAIIGVRKVLADDAA